MSKKKNAFIAEIKENVMQQNMIDSIFNDSHKISEWVLCDDSKFVTYLDANASRVWGPLVVKSRSNVFSAFYFAQVGVSCHTE